MSTPGTEQAIIEGLDFADYLQIPALSKSLLTAIQRSPGHLKHRETHPLEQTPAMAIGSAVDALIFDGPQLFAMQYVTAPQRPEELPGHFVEAPEDYTGRKKADKEWKAEQEAAGRVVVKPADWNGSGLKLASGAGQAWKRYAEEQGQTILTPSDMRNVRSCADAVWDCTPAENLLGAGRFQLSLVWADPEHTDANGEPIWLKGRPDCYVTDPEGIEPPMVVDLKTTDDADPETFARKAYGLRYHWQAAMYCDGLEAITGEPHMDFAFIVAEREPPHRVEVYRVPLSILEQGRAEYRAALAKYAYWSKRDEWPTCSGEILDLVFPKWATR